MKRASSALFAGEEHVGGAIVGLVGAVVALVAAGDARSGCSDADAGDAAGSAVCGVLPRGDDAQVAAPVPLTPNAAGVLAAGASDEFGAPHRVPDAVDPACDAAGMGAGFLDLQGGAVRVRGDGFACIRVPDCALLAYGSGGIPVPDRGLFASGGIHVPDDGLFTCGGIHTPDDGLFVSGGIHTPDGGLFAPGAVRGRDERGRRRMRGVVLQCRRESEAPRLGEAGERRDGLQAELPLGEGAGLVGETVGGEREPFDRVRAGGDETGAGEGAEGRGHRGRGGEREGAGTGHHQDRDQHRNHPGRIVDQPSDGDAGREHEDAADEPRRGPIRELRDGRPLAGRLLGLAEHSAEHGGIPRARHLDLDHPGAVDGAGEHLAPGRARDRIRLSGEQRFVERGVSGADGAVGGDYLSGAYAHPVAGAKRGGGYPFGLRGVAAAVVGAVASRIVIRLYPGFAVGSALAHPGGDERSGAGEGADCRGGPAAGEQLKVAGAAQQGDEHHHRVEPDVSLSGDCRKRASEEGD